MKYITGILVAMEWLATAQAVNVNGDPTDLTNYPACAVRRPSRSKVFNRHTDRVVSKIVSLYPLGHQRTAAVFRTEHASAPPLVSLMLLRLASSRLVAERSATVSRSCSRPFKHLVFPPNAGHPKIEIDELGAALCAPVGGIGPTLSQIAASILESTQLQIPTTPTYSPFVTGLSQASVVLATATLTPNLGNPASSSEQGSQVYPPCVVSPEA